MQQLIFYIAHRACDSLGKTSQKFHLNGTRDLIAATIIFHFLQIVVLVEGITDQSIELHAAIRIILFVVCWLLISYYLSKTLTIEVLKAAYEKYHAKRIAFYAKEIGVAYFILNATVLALLFMWVSKE